MTRIHRHSAWAIRYWIGRKTWGLLTTASLDEIVTFRTKAAAEDYIRCNDGRRDGWEAVELIVRDLG